MFNRIGFKKSIFALGVAFVMLFLPSFYGSSVFAESTSEINLDLWGWEENCDDLGNVQSLFLTEYYADDKDTCENIIIPNVYNIFLEGSDSSKYKNLKTVFISKSVMNELAKKVSKYNGTLKVSHSYGATVAAFGEDWSDCFNFENNNIKEIDLSYFDTKGIKNMSNMFANCKNLEMLNISGFDTIDVENMSGMFSGCESLKEVDLSSFDTEKVVDMHEMFFDCKKLKQLDLSNFDTQNVKDVSKMFKNTDLRIVDLSSFSFDNEMNTEEMFDELSENNLLVLSSGSNVLTELTKNRHAMDLEFIFGKDERFVFDGVVFCPSDLGVTKKRNESLDDYLDRILEKAVDIFKELIKEKNGYLDGTIISCQPEENYSTIEEKLNGKYVVTVKLPLVEGTDFEWPGLGKDLKYDGQSKELLDGGFISEELKNNGVKFEYTLPKRVNEIVEKEWNDQIPTATDIGSYEICMRVNGGEKYQTVYYVNEKGSDCLKVKIYKWDLQKGKDYEFAEASSNLKYDGNEKELLSGGFVSQKKKKMME